ncbi:hypothetical protein HDU90_003347 [Geranomyces variabilis]|nr:hypothetical protein HDU90_003347 [Geranomyces variabilis]
MHLSHLIIGASAVLSAAVFAAPAAPPAHVLAARDDVPEGCHYKCYKGNEYEGEVGIWWGGCSHNGNGKGGDGNADWACNQWESGCGGQCHSVWKAPPRVPDDPRCPNPHVHCD